MIRIFLLGENTIQNKTNNRRYQLWLGGVLLVFIFVGFIGVSLVKDPVESSSGGSSAAMGTQEPEEQAEAAQRFAHSIPAGLPGKPGTTRHKSLQAGGIKPVKFDSKKQRNLVQTSLLRRYDENSAHEREDKLSMPEWEKIINPDGTLKDDVNEDGMFGSNGIPDYIDLYRGIDADFIQDNISNGLATDMSALLPGPRLEDEVLYNGAVRPEHDLGNAYVLATIGADNHLRVYAGIERLATDAVTYIEIELNQNPVRIGEGAPWPIVGYRVEGDLLVRMVFANQALQSVQLEQWRQGGFSFIQTDAGIAGDACRQKREFMYCIGLPPIQQPVEEIEVWDEDSNYVDPTLPNSFVELGIDIDLLLGPQTDITSVLFRTPEDIAMNSFQVFEQLAQLDQLIATKTGLRK